MSKPKEPYLVFYHGAQELLAYTLRGTFPGEKEDTITLLAAEHQIAEADIHATCEMR